MIGVRTADTCVRIDLVRIEERLPGFRLEDLPHDRYFDPIEQKAKSSLEPLDGLSAICVPSYRSPPKNTHLYWVPLTPR